MSAMLRQVCARPGMAKNACKVRSAKYSNKKNASSSKTSKLKDKLMR